MSAREYTATYSFSLSELNKVVELQRVALEAAKNNQTNNVIQAAINGVGAAATLIGLAFASTTAVGVAAGITSVISGGLNNTLFRDSLQAGLNKTIGHLTWFVSNSSNYKKVEFEIAFLEYDTAGGNKIRFITQASSITRLQLNDGSWIGSY